MFRNLVCSIFSFALVTSAFAWQPSKPIEVTVPFPQGSANDVIIRTLIPAVERNTGARFTVVNRPGAGGTVGTILFVNKPNDGHYINIVSSGGIAAMDYTWPNFVNNTPYSVSSFTYATAIARSSLVVISNKNDPVSTPSELVDVLLKEKNVTVADSGGTGQLGLENILLQINAIELNPSIIRIKHKGPMETITDVSGNHVRFGTVPLSVAYQHHINGKIKIIGLIQQTKISSLEFETFASVNKNIEVDLVWGIALPKETPKEILDWYAKAFKEAQNDLKVKEVFNRNQYFSVSNLSTPEEFTNFIISQNKAHESVVKLIVNNSKK
jgi:tripartite-type tricarboxylate transporter receptor subunit TctC